MKKGLILGLLFCGLQVMALPGAPALIKESETIVSTNASTWWDDRYGDAYLNCLSFNQDSLISYQGWQYAAYYNSSRYVTLSRRKLPDGLWETIVLGDYHQTTDDNHNTISMGISPRDGRIHLAFDHHSSTLHYRVSSPGLADNTGSTLWSPSAFSSVHSSLGSGTVTMLTYPGFITAPDGTFLMKARIGTSGDGDSYLWRYNDNGTWTTMGKFLEGGEENAYFHGMMYDGNNRLHGTWCWRATSSGYTNHDLLYAYSDDNGLSWKNNYGQILAVTGSDPIVTAKNFKVATIPQYGGLINQETMTIDTRGRVHVFSREDINGTNYQVHYWRDINGTWTRNNTGIPTKIWDNRSTIAYDSEGNLYGIMPNLRLAAASVSANYTDWTVLDTSDDGRFHHSEPLIDPYALLTGKDDLYVFVQEGTTSSTSSDLLVIHYKMGTASQLIPGDADNSGEVDIIDALMTAQFYVGIDLPGYNEETGDVNCDGMITIVDALMIAQFYVGLLYSLDC